MHTQSRSSLTARHACQHLHIPHKHHVRCRASAAAEQSGQHQTAAAAAAASQQQAAAASIRQLLTRRSWAPSRYVGPVNVSVIPGKRFGLTAARNLSVGEVLLVAPPLTASFGPTGDAPGNEVLVQQLQGAQLEPWQLQWLRVLNRGEQQQPQQQQPSAAAAGVDAAGAAAAAAAGDAVEQPQPVAADAEAQALLPMMQQLLQHGSDGSPSSTSSQPAAAATGDISVASVTCPLTTEELTQIISENAYCEPAEDLGAALLRELDPEAVAGLWPEYSLLNHSCVPNTLAVCVGRYLLLHVTGAVLKGEELTCSYLGEKSFAPIGFRRAYLQGVYGFHCVCERCVAEQRTFPTQYYPADDAVLGLSNSSSGGSGGSNGGSNGGSSGVVSQLLSAVGGLLGGGQRQQEGGLAAAVRPNPSAQHMLLQRVQQMVTQELRPALAAATTADSRRTEQQLQLLAQVTELVDDVLDEVAAAVAGDAYLQEQLAAATKWVLAAAYPLLQLQLELLELLLASGELPVDETQLLLDEAATYSSGGSNGSGGGAMAAAGAAATARLSLNSRSSKSSSAAARRRRRQRLQQQQTSRNTIPGLLAGLWGRLLSLRDGGSSSQPDGPVAKRQLLGLYAQGLGRAVGVLDAVARGSEAHVVAAIKHMDAVRRLAGMQAEETALAEGLCGRAHAARYGVHRGAEGQALFARLISARRRQLLGASLAKKMGVLAWEAATKR